VIAIAGLHARIGTFELEVDDLCVPAGRYGVLLGPSGAGKSLLLKAVAGLLRPDCGRIFLAGEDATALPPERRSLGLVFQEASLFPHLTVRANLAYGLVARRLGAAECARRIDSLADRMGLGPILDRPTPALSGGEAQKVALARALATEPRVLLLDEPLSQVDQDARADLVELLRALQRERGLTCLHVTHSRDEALALADHCAIMFRGKVLQQGSLDSLRARPLCPLVARFLALPPAAHPPLPTGCSEACLSGHGACPGGQT